MPHPACIRLDATSDDDGLTASATCVHGDYGAHAAGLDGVAALLVEAAEHQAVHDPVATNADVGVEVYEGDAVQPEPDTGIVALTHGLGTKAVMAEAFAADGSRREVIGVQAYDEQTVDVLATPDTVKVVLMRARVAE